MATHRVEEQLDLPSWAFLGNDSSWHCTEETAQCPWQTRMLLISGWPEAEDWTRSWKPLHMSVVALSKCVGSLVILSSNSRMISGMFSVSSVQDKCFQTRRSLLKGVHRICLSFYLSRFYGVMHRSLSETVLHKGQLTEGVCCIPSASAVPHAKLATGRPHHGFSSFLCTTAIHDRMQNELSPFAWWPEHMVGIF